MPITIPLDASSSHYLLETQIDGVTYTVEARHNARAGGWFLSLYTLDGDPIFAGARIVVDMPIGIRCVDARKPPGVFVAVDTSGERRDPDVDDLGTRVVLLYYAADELPAEPEPSTE